MVSDQELNLGHLAEEFAKLLVDVPQAAVSAGPVRLEEGERREVTILFLDLVGYTSLAERLDPEQLKFVVSNTLQVFTNQVRKCGGTVEKFIGDAVMALFGRAQAHEDDSRRAIAAAQAILDRLEDINSILAQRGIKLHARIGINRGLIVTGQLAEHETVTGEAINIAQRLEANAPEDGILISDSVYSDCAAHYRCEPMGPLHVKNKTEPVLVYRVGEELPMPTVGTHLGTGPFVGRDGELATMQMLAARARDGQMSILQISGEAGIGKSRLVLEFVNRFPPHPSSAAACVYVTATSFGQPPYHVLSDVVREYLEQSKCDLATFLARVADSTMLAGLQEYQVYLHDLLGIPLTPEQQSTLEVMEPRARQAETLLALKRFLVAAAQDAKSRGAHPLLIIVDNLQWVTHASHDAMGQILQTLAHDLPLLWILVGRPTEVGQWLPSNLSVTTLNLTALTSDAVEEAIRSRFPDQEVSGTFCRQIVDRTGGNPLFLSEILNAVARIGTIAQFSMEELLPGSIKSLVLSRLDHLPRPQKFALQVAAVAGREFSTALLTHVLDRVQYPFEAQPTMAELVQADLLAEAPVDGTFGIAQPMVADVVYTTILHTNRRTLHGLVAQWVEECHHDNLRPYAPFLAEQWDRAGQGREALANYLEAGFAAKAGYAYRDAVMLFERALQLLREEPAGNPASENADAMPIAEQFGLVYVTLVHLYEALGNIEAQERYIREGTAALPPASWGALALHLRTWHLQYERGDASGAAAGLRDFAREKVLQTYPDIQIDCHTLRGLIAWERGEEAAPAIEAALALRPAVEKRMKQYDDARPYDRYRLAADASTLYKIDTVIFNHYKNNNELRKAEEHFCKVLEGSESRHTFAQHMAHLFYCSLMWDRGVEFGTIATRAALARAYFREIGWGRGVGWGAFYRGAALWRMGQFTDAHQTITEALQQMERMNDTYLSGRLELLLAAVFLARGDMVGYQLRKQRLLNHAEGRATDARLALQREFAVFEGQTACESHQLAKIYEELVETATAPLPKVEADECAVTMALVAVQLGHAPEAMKQLGTVRASIEQNVKKRLMGLIARVDGIVAAQRRDIEAVHRAFGSSVVYLHEVGAQFDAHLSYQQWWRAIERLGLEKSVEGVSVRRGLAEWQPPIAHHQ